MRSPLPFFALAGLLWASSACGTIEERKQEREFEDLAERVREEPGNLDLHARLGSKLAERGYSRKAIEVWESAYRAHPREHRFLRLIADRRYAIGLWKAAIADYQKLLGLAPAADPEILYRMGWAKLEMGDLVGAQESFQAFVSVRFNDADGYIGLGLAQWRRSSEQGNEYMLELAGQSFQRALMLDPKSEAARFNAALVQEKKGLPEQAAKEYRTLLAQNPLHAQALENLALLEAAAGRAEEARALLQRALALEKDKKIKKAIEEKLSSLGASTE